jgi:hypothetical protein
MSQPTAPKIAWSLSLSLLIGSVLVGGVSRLRADNPEQQRDEPRIPRVSLEVARDRAQLTHDIYAASLDAMHHRYFRGDRTTVPARAMVDVFTEIQRKHNIEARWISASFSPMSIDHAPETDFEKQAARQLAKGDEAVETVEGGFYRRAGSIPLNGGCITCHHGLFAAASPGKKFAGLVISIPVEPETTLPPPGAATPE